MIAEHPNFVIHFNIVNFVLNVDQKIYWCMMIDIMTIYNYEVQYVYDVLTYFNKCRSNITQNSVN